MERLTGRRDGRAYIVGCPDFALPKIAGLIIQQTVDRLATIEDILGDGYDLERLRELVEADRDGRCVVLPCKIGDTLWLLNQESGKYVIQEAQLSFSFLEDFGKTAFLTREAAERALKGKQNG